MASYLKTSLTESKHGSSSFTSQDCQICTFPMHRSSHKSSKQNKTPSLKFWLHTAVTMIICVTQEDIVKFRDRWTRTQEPTPFEKESIWQLGSFLSFVLNPDSKSNCLQVSEECKIVWGTQHLKSAFTLSVQRLQVNLSFQDRFSNLALNYW